MKKIVEYIFGKKLHIRDERIGSLSARIRSKDPSKEYTWSSETTILNQSRKTVFLLNGNHNGPFESQLRLAYRIIDEFDSIIKQTDIEIRKKTNEFGNWKNELYLSAIMPNIHQTNEFELVFDSTNSESTRNIGMIWADGTIKEIGWQ